MVLDEANRCLFFISQFNISKKIFVLLSKLPSFIFKPVSLQSLNVRCGRATVGMFVNVIQLPFTLANSNFNGSQLIIFLNSDLIVSKTYLGSMINSSFPILSSINITGKLYSIFKKIIDPHPTNISGF